MSLSSLQNIFNKVLAEEKVFILFRDKKQYDATRIALLRKWRTHKAMLDSLGAANPYEGKFLQCSFEKEQVRGKFMLAEDDKRKNVPVRERYNIQEL